MATDFSLDAASTSTSDILRQHQQNSATVVQREHIQGTFFFIIEHKLSMTY